jgi:hypothetical protein
MTPMRLAARNLGKRRSGVDKTYVGPRQEDRAGRRLGAPIRAVAVAIQGAGPLGRTALFTWISMPCRGLGILGLHGEKMQRSQKICEEPEVILSDGRHTPR